MNEMTEMLIKMVLILNLLCYYGRQSEKWSRLREQKKLLEMELKEPMKKKEGEDRELINIDEPTKT